jgi:hypothetical protein
MNQYMNKKYIIAIACLAALACAFAVWKLHSSAPNEAAATHTSHYAVKNGTVYWEEYMQVYTGENTPSEWRLNEIEIPGADAATFKTVPLKKGVDLEADADPQIFVAEDNVWGKDKENIFNQGQIVVHLDGTTTPIIDTATFETVGNVFIRDKQGVYQVQNHYYWLIPGVDPKSFVFVNRQYVKDTNAVYFLQYTGTKYEVLPIAGLDPSTFHVIGTCGGAESYRTYAATDTHTVLAGDTPIKGADAATFRIVSEYDKNPDGFPMTGSYAVDKNHVYKDCTQVVAGADPAQCTAGNLKGCKAQ